MDKTYLVSYTDRSSIPAKFAIDEFTAKSKLELFDRIFPSLGIAKEDVICVGEVGVHMFEGLMSDTQDPDEDDTSLSDFPEYDFNPS